MWEKCVQKVITQERRKVVVEDQSTILPGKGEDEDDVEKPRKKLIRAGLPDEMTQCSNDRGGYIPVGSQTNAPDIVNSTINHRLSMLINATYLNSPWITAGNLTII